ncbi:hypothetical protein LIER_37967 [Lithospermum erythrorhizon]|uniref:Mitochondrial protein n=1 Tax=Lithospermum erythrorhizon TaxID=34254 RepID=A0AAV3PWS0_LITER
MKNNIFISQSKYAKNLVKKFALENTKLKRTPAATHVKVSTNIDSSSIDISNYRSMIGSLLYLTTRRRVNTSGKATKGKKKGVWTSDDTCMDIDAPIVNVKAEKEKEQKMKAKRSKTPVSIGTSEVEGPVLDVMPLRSIPMLMLRKKEYKRKSNKKIHNFYLPWVDYTNVRELDNLRPRKITMEDDDVGGERSHDEINIEENVIGEEDTPIIEERVGDSSATEVTDIVDVSEPSVTTSVKDIKGKTAKPSIISEEHVEINSGSSTASDVSVSCVMCRGHDD